MQKRAAGAENLATGITLNLIQVNYTSMQDLRTLCTAVCGDECTLH